MLRLFSTFARGLPGTGLLLMRLVAGIAVIARAVAILWGGPKLGPAMLQVLAAGVGLLLLAGLWTPIAGALMAVIYIWDIFSNRRICRQRFCWGPFVLPLRCLVPALGRLMPVCLGGNASTFAIGTNSSLSRSFPI